MRIRVVQSGGIAGLRSEHELDTERLSGEAQQRVGDLVQGVAFFGAPAGAAVGTSAPLPSPPASRMPDVLQYHVRIEDGERTHEITFDDACAQSPLLELVECVTALAKGHP